MSAWLRPSVGFGSASFTLFQTAPRLGLLAGAAFGLALLLPSCNDSTQSTNGDGGVNRDMVQGSGDMNGPTGPVSVMQAFPDAGLLAGGEELTLVGDGFALGPTVLFGDRQGTNVQVLSKTQLKVTTPAGAALGPVVITVKNSDGMLGTAATAFSYVRVRVVLGDVMNPTLLTVGTHPVAVVAADVDGDSKPDLITANEGSGDVTVLKNSQSFMTPTMWPIAVSPTSLVVAELDGRSGLDVAVGCNNGDSKDVGVLLNAGTGNFSAVATFAVARNPAGIVARDLTGDGKAELILALRTTNHATVLTNTTMMNAAFTMGASYALGASPAALAFAELTGDTYPELLSVNEAGNSVSVLPGSAGGLFQAMRTVSSSGRPLSFAIGDLTGDGKADLIVPGADSQQLNVLRGKGDGTFDAPTMVAVGRGPRAAAIADIDGDGKADALVLNSAGSTLDVLLGKGDGTFEPTQRLPLAGTPYALVVADLNADAKPDVAVVGYDSNKVMLMINKTQR